MPAIPSTNFPPEREGKDLIHLTRHGYLLPFPFPPAGRKSRLSRWDMTVHFYEA